jgi:hypothetical protein
MRPITLLKSPFPATETTLMARLRLTALLAALALVAAACGGSGSPGSESTTSSTLGRPATTSPTTLSTTDSTAGSSGPDVSDEIQERIDELIIEAQQIRGLDFLEPVEVLLLTDEEYSARFAEIIEEDLAVEDVEAINALLRTLGIIEPGDDYRDLLETFLSAGTGGFYDPDTEELVIRLVSGELGPQAESVVIHELVHALQDQHFELLDAREDLEGDPAYVAQAIIEGDALLREATFVQSLSLAQQAKYVAEISDIDLSALDTLPGYIVNSLQAAYLDGFLFHQQVGLDAIDDQFINPPDSSEQLIEPGKYQRDEQPKEATLPAFSLPGYDLWFDAPAGQKDLELMLTDGVGPGRAAEAASGWGGDINRVYNAGDEEAVYVLLYVGDTKKDAEELETAFVDFIDALVPADVYTFVERTEDTVLVIIASDPAVGPDLRAAFSQ